MFPAAAASAPRGKLALVIRPTRKLANKWLIRSESIDSFAGLP
jgi:hypothetical protein